MLTPQVENQPLIVPVAGILFALLGGFSLGAAIYLAARAGWLTALMMPLDQPTAVTRIAWVPVIVGAGMLALLGEINAMLLNQPILNEVSSRAQIGLFICGISLVVWGFAGARRPRIPVWDRKEIALVAVIVLLALFTRMVGLDSAIRVLVDEQHAADATRGAEGIANLKILRLMSGAAPFPMLHPLMIADADRIFGRNLVGLRAANAILGTIGIVGVYLLGRALFDRKTAFIAAAILIAFPLHLHYSRIAQLLMGDIVFGTLALAFAARGIKHNRNLDWAIGGAMLGVSQYFYDAGRLLFPVLIIAWLGFMALTRRGFWRIYWRGAAILLVVTILVSAPYYYTFASQGKMLGTRLSASGLRAGFWQETLRDGIDAREMQMITERFMRPFLLYVFLPEPSLNPEYLVYYAGTEPLVLRPFTPLLLLGLFYVLWRWRSPSLVIAIWPLATALAVGLFMRDNMSTPRFVIATPALALLMAVGIRYVPPLLTPIVQSSGKLESQRWRTFGTYGVPVLLVVVIGVVNLYYYFGPHLEHFNLRNRRDLLMRDVWDVVLRAADLPYNTHTIVIGAPPPPVVDMRNFLGYLQYRDRFPIESYETSQITPEFLVNLPRDRNYAFFIQPSELDAFNQIYNVYPEAQPPSYTTTAMLPNEEFVLVYVPLLPDEAANRRW